MAKFITFIFIIVAFSAVGQAALPKNPSINEYRSLLSRSAFVIKKPVVPTQQPVINNSLTLRGVSMLDDGWFVTVVDRKDSQKRIYLREGAPANKDGIKLIKVNKNKDDYMKTTVTVMTGTRKMTIAYNSTDIKNGIAKATQVVRKSPANPSSASRPSSSVKPPVPTSRSTTRRPRVRRTPTTSVPRTK